MNVLNWPFPLLSSGRLVVVGGYIDHVTGGVRQAMAPLLGKVSKLNTNTKHHIFVYSPLVTGNLCHCSLMSYSGSTEIRCPVARGCWTRQHIAIAASLELAETTNVLSMCRHSEIQRYCKCM